MEAYPEKNHLNTVAELLYEQEPPTDEQHLDIVEHGVQGDMSGEQLSQAVEYVDENFNDPEIALDAKLHIAEKAALGLGEFGRTSFGQYGPETEADIIIDVASSVFDTYDTSEAVYKNKLKRAGALVQDLVNIRISWLASVDAQKDGRQVKYFDEISYLALQYIDKAKESGEPSAYLGKRPHEAYGELIERTATASPISSDQKKSHIDQILEKALESIDANTEGGVKFCLDNHQARYAWMIPDKSLLLDKALDVTKSSSKDAQLEEKRSIFGIKREAAMPSVFESRRETLRSFSVRHFQELLKDSPDFIKEVAKLHNNEEPADLKYDSAKMWKCYGDMVASIGFLNGHYSTHDIKNLQPSLEAFQDIAPPEIGERTKLQVKERLSASTATAMYR